MVSKASRLRRDNIRSAIIKLGGNPQVREIARELGLSVNGVSQTTGVMDDLEYTQPPKYKNGGDLHVSFKVKS